MSFSGLSGNFSRPVPPPGTSARKAYEKTVQQGTGAPKTTTERLTGTYNYPVKSTVTRVVNGVVPNTPKPKRKRSPVSVDSGSSPSVPVPAPAPSAKSSFKYYEAPIAKKYGFGRATAYQEALANTAYRREMDDMRKAGLNPSVIYGSHSTYGAGDNIYPTDDVVSSGYSAPASSGGSGGSYRRSRGGNSGKYLFSGGAYYGIMAATAALTTAVTGNLGAGLAASAIAATGMKALNGFFRK